MQGMFTKRVSLAQMSMQHAMERKVAMTFDTLHFVLDRMIVGGKDDTMYDYYFEDSELVSDTVENQLGDGGNTLEGKVQNEEL